MNTVPSPVPTRPAALTMDLVADYTCPWSFLGVRRIGRALSNLQGLVAAPDLRWHGFRLPRPDNAGAESAVWRFYLASRLSPEVTPEFAESSLADAGGPLGIAFNFAAIRSVPDTSQAHRLTLIAVRDGRQAAVADGIFRAYFEQGRDIGDTGVLASIGLDAGMSEASIAAFADAGTEASALALDERRLQALGVNNVPNLLLNGRVLVPGAADVDTYVLALDQALFPAAGEPAARPLLN